MESATTERRAPEGTRVPLDLWIQLAHEDYEEPFDADGVDLSEGGLSLRADYLPEIGDRMRCRFDSPPSGEPIAVDGEVVWAHDAGERCGEFGLRFDDLDGELRERLQRLVGHLRGEASDVARLHLDGVSSAIEAQVLERDGRWLTVEQELPFLRMGMGVTVEQREDAPRGRLASVDLRVVDGTPRLVLSVELDALSQLDESAATAERTYDDDERLEVGAAQTLDEPSDATVQDFLPPDSGEREPRQAQEVARSPEPARRDAVQVFEVSQKPEDEAGEPDETPGFEARDSISTEAPARSAQERLGALGGRLNPLWTRARAGLTSARKKTRPALNAAWSKMLTLVALVASKVGPGARVGWGKIRALFSQLPGRKPKRRTTATPARRRVAGAPRRQQRAEAPAPVAAPRNRRKLIAMSAVAFLGVGGTVYALTGAEADASADGGSETTTVLPDTALPTPTPAPAGLLAAPSAPTLPAASPPEPAADGAEAAPETPAAGGQLGAPSFPSLRDADPTSAPVTEGQTFGASSVSDARSATIRMSQPVTTLRGQPRDNGFTVTIPGALALDRAGPIAASNPSVERASVINLGDHAVLTVRFVAGRSPDYRVVARGRAIEIEIGR